MYRLLWAALLVCALVACALRMAPCLAPREALLYDAPALHSTDGVYEDLYEIENIPLQQGIYTVEVPYEAKDKAMALIQVPGREYEPILQGNIFTIFPERNTLRFRLYVNAPDLAARFFCFPTEEESAFRPLALRIHYRPATTALYEGIRTLVPFLLLAFLLWLIPHLVFRQDRTGRLIFLCLLLAFVVMNLPFYQDFYPHGHDTNFHMLRAEYIGAGLRAGDFPVRMQEGWFADYGLPVGVYYPDLLLYFPAALFLCGLPLWHAYRLYGIAMNLGMVFLSYHAFKRIANDRVAGALAAAVYSLGVRYFMNTYPRGATGEAVAMLFFPLIALGLADIARDNYRRGSVALSLGFTGVLQTHVISVRMVLVFCVITCLFGGATYFRKGRLFAILKAAGLTLLLNLFFIVPFLDYLLRNDIEATGGNEIFARSGITWQQLFVKTEELSYSPGWSVGLVLVAALGLLVAGKLCGRVRLEERGPLLVSLLVGLVAVWFSTNAFPYEALTRIFPPTDLLIGSFMRLKTRYLSIAAVAFAVLCAYVTVELKKKWQKKPFLFAGFVSLLLLLAFSQNYVLAREYVANAEPMTPYSSAGITPYDETLYVFRDVDITQVADNSLHPLGEGLHVDALERNGLRFALDVRNEGGADAAIDFPLWNYHGYTAVAGDGTALAVSDGENRRVRVTIPAGFAGRVQVRYREPLFWRAAETVSLLAGLALLFLWIRQRRKA